MVNVIIFVAMRVYLPSEAAATARVNAECEPYVAVALRAIAALTLTLLLSGLLSGGVS